MYLKRVARLPRDETPLPCDLCELPAEPGYELHHGGCGGKGCPGTTTICDDCLTRVRSHPLKLLTDEEAIRS